jgi:hypothetical protein
MVTNDGFSAFNELDLEPIKQKLMHRKAGKGWAKERAEAVEREYRRFLYLAKTFPDAPLAPVVDVDEFWHYHILDTKKYAADCERVFGYFLHHFPYAGMRGKEDEEALQRVGNQTGAMYEQMFGENYAANMSSMGKPAQTALSFAVRLSKAFGAPSLDAAYCYTPGAKTQAKAAYCFTPGEKVQAEAAYCFTPGEKVQAEAAYCFTPGEKVQAEAAYCFTPGEKVQAKAAYCFTPGEKVQAEAAYCYTPGAKAEAKAAYCYVAIAECPDEAAPANELGSSRPLEGRPGFYLERPRLQAA